jgi:anaerobic carbon-monoxide dehydrogenase catalytic subunit
MNTSYEERTITRDGRLLLKKADRDGLETVWDRFETQQPQCGYCEMGLSCRICVMGPCRIDPFGEGPQRGVCGADADIIVARNLGRMIAAAAEPEWYSEKAAALMRRHIETKREGLGLDARPV